MKKEIRRAIAYIVARAVTHRTLSHVFDLEDSQYVNFSGTVKPNQVHVYDFGAGSFITGNGDSYRMNLFHFGQSSYINLNVTGRQFRGFDFGTGMHFSGFVSGNVVNIHDFGTSQNHQYMF